MQLNKKNSKQKAFTLIELLVSIALFSVVLTITMGSIITISDSNKKARSLMSVMNNLNFAVDSVTRSFKTGVIFGITDPVFDYGDCVKTNEINYDVAQFGGFGSRSVEYCFASNGTQGKITKNGVDLTSPDVDIDYLKFIITNDGVGYQPVLNIILSGTVKVSEKISSKFSLQTSVSQRQLNI